MIRPGASLDEHALDRMLDQVPRRGDLEVDLGAVEFVDPHGMVSLLELGRWLSREGRAAALHEPHSDDVDGYLERMGFWAQAARFFRGVEPRPAPRRGSDVLLEATPIERAADVHAILARVRSRARAILAGHLGYDALAVDRFLVALSEVCQNVLEHSGDVGFVAIQKYFYRESLGRNVVKIGVSDLGAGVRATLEGRLGRLSGDLDALDKAVLQGVSRHGDPGRGHGLRAVRETVVAWEGKLSVRSGAGRLSLLPSWARGKTREARIAPFPGTQLFLTLPALTLPR